MSGFDPRGSFSGISPRDSFAGEPGRARTISESEKKFESHFGPTKEKAHVKNDEFFKERRVSHDDASADGAEKKRKSLRAELDAQQLRTFTRWWNSWLVEQDLSLKDLCEDVKAGVLPIKLLEILSESSCGKYCKRPLSTFQMLENHTVFLAQLKAKQCAAAAPAPEWIVFLR